MPRSGNLEALWLNNGAFPFDSKAVRQAVAYSIDRDAIVKRLFGSLGIDRPQQSFNTPDGRAVRRRTTSRSTRSTSTRSTS